MPEGEASSGALRSRGRVVNRQRCFAPDTEHAEDTMEMNWLAAAVATVVGMVVTFIWYGKLFEHPWERLTGVSSERLREKWGRWPMLVLALSVTVTAIGLTATVSVVASARGHSSVGLALAVGAAAWIAFSASTLVQHNTFEIKPPRLTLINSAYQLVLFLSMALVAGLM